MPNDPAEGLQARAPSSAAGTRFDAVAAALFDTHSRSRLQAWIAAGYLTVDGVRRRPKDRLLGGETLALELPANVVADLAAADWDGGAQGVPADDTPVPVAWEDEHVIVVDKPVGLVMHPAPGNPRGTLMNGLLAHAPALRGVPRAGIVHRLDKDTSGLCVVARTLEAHTALVRQLQAREVRRDYLAIAIGEPPDEGRVDEPIGRDPHDRKRMAVVYGGKRAVTHFAVERRVGKCAVVAVRLETGRTHQIRVHLTHLGCPLVGDTTYRDGRTLATSFRQGTEGRRIVDAFPRQALHARGLGFVHPATRAAMTFESAVPADMVALEAELEQARVADREARQGRAR